MAALLACALLLLPALCALGAVLALLPMWLGTLLWLPVVTVALIGVPLYLIGGAIHAAATAGRDLRRRMAEAEAHHRAILAGIAARHGAPPQVRRYRLGAVE